MVQVLEQGMVYHDGISKLFSDGGVPWRDPVLLPQSSESAVDPFME